MQRFLVKKPLYSTHFSFLSSIHRLFSTSLPLIKFPFAMEYLVKSCGLPREKAIRASRYIPNLKSPSNPDCVLHFLRERGLSDADIRKTVTSQPRILCASLEKSIKPILMEFHEIGFSPSQVTRLIPLTPIIFCCNRRSLQRMVDFWLPFLGSLEGILRALKKAPYLFTVSVDLVVKPNISFLQEHCGVSPTQIGKIIPRTPWLLMINPMKFKDAAQKAEKLGIPQGSGLFIYALQITLSYTPKSLNAKIKNLNNLGFSKKEIDSMIKKSPMLLTNSDERIQSSVEFLTSEAGLDLPYIAHQPVLISLSLERRVIPRNYVLKTLESKALCKNLAFSTVMNLSEDKFADRFVKPYKDIIPEVFEAYEVARAGKISLKGKKLQEKDLSRIEAPVGRP